MNDPLLLDTCAAIWLLNGDPLSVASRTAITNSQAGGSGVYVSPITAWEIGVLASKGRIRIALPVEAWFARLIALPGVRLIELSPAILIRSTGLPGEPPSDPADRMIIAAARDLGAAVVTRDQKILAYAAAGHVRAIQC